MQFKFINSGSGGNCFIIMTNSATVAIDIGLNKTQTEQKLLDNGVRPDSIDAIFLTHGHKDHCSGLPMAKKWNIPVYASEGTWKTVKFDGMRDIMPENWFMGSTYVSYFRTFHDDYDSFGFTVTDGNKKVSICLDTGKIDADMIQAMRGSTHYIIESNHDVDKTILDTTRPESVKQRNLGEYGHLSNDQTAEALCKLIRGRGEHIYLAHLSRACNSPALAKLATINALKKKGFEFGKHYKLGCV